jgi:hypothetical protein
MALTRNSPISSKTIITSESYENVDTSKDSKELRIHLLNLAALFTKESKEATIPPKDTKKKLETDIITLSSLLVRLKEIGGTNERAKQVLYFLGVLLVANKHLSKDLPKKWRVNYIQVYGGSACGYRSFHNLQGAHEFIERTESGGYCRCELVELPDSPLLVSKP